MFLELLAVIFAGVAGAGIMMVIIRATGGRLPKWLTPVAAGAVMIAVSISSEYTWFNRTAATLPAGLEVVETVETSALWRPWTYAVPITERFVVLDTASIQTNAAQPNLRLGQVYFYGRWSPLNRLNVATDCQSNRRAALIDAVTFTSDGALNGAEWVSAAQGDPLIEAMCKVS